MVTNALIFTFTFTFAFAFAFTFAPQRYISAKLINPRWVN